MRLHPIDDGVVRRPDERGVIAVPWPMVSNKLRNRESLATEIARRSTDEPSSIKAPRTATMVNGVPYDFQTDMFGNEVNRRRIRLVTDGDDPLGRFSVKNARKPRAAKSPRAPRPRGSVSTVSNRTADEPRVTTKITNVEVDKIIRGTGYTGPINRTMRVAARDAISHRASLAAYTS